MKLIRENLLLLALSVGIFLAWHVPDPGQLFKQWGIVNGLIFLIFFCQGMGLEGKHLRKGSQLLKTVGWGFIVSQVLGPVLGYVCVRGLDWQADNQVGFVLICCMAPTLVSGTVLAIRAGGEGATALVLAVGINLIGILTVPVNLQWSLGAAVNLDPMGLLFKLVFLVLAPAIGGQLIRQWRPELAHKGQSFIRNGPIIFLAIIVYISCSSQADRLKELTLSHLISLLGPSVSVHLILLAAGYFGGKYIFRIRKSACRSLAIVCSQKTLPIAIAVWSIAFARAYPLAVLPLLVFHPSQIICDGVLAAIWGKRRV
ncbi:MAG: bile acid:sodium symporter [Deltaproteobacteria bacterium]|nr:MAG: bile acid:sodium symporter [Deltaproteobacteria bacterium]